MAENPRGKKNHFFKVRDSSWIAKVYPFNVTTEAGTKLRSCQEFHFIEKGRRSLHRIFLYIIVPELYNLFNDE